MNRRQFFQSAAGAAALLFLPAKLPRARARQHIVIIGAGLAGLAAARALRTAGHEALVLEAADHIGGRARGLETLPWSPVQLARGVDLQLGTPVRRVVQRGSGVIVETDGAALEAASVLVTLPPAVLASGALAIDGLDAGRRRAAERLARASYRWDGGRGGAARSDDVETLAQPWGAIHFAGEATIVDGFQTASGAVRSGLREARRLTRGV